MPEARALSIRATPSLYPGMAPVMSDKNMAGVSGSMQTRSVRYSAWTLYVGEEKEMTGPFDRINCEMIIGFSLFGDIVFAYISC